MPDEPEWADLAAQRAQWLRIGWLGGKPGPAELAREAQRNLAAFTDYCTSGDRSDATDLYLAAMAMVFFGPASTPPAEVWDTFVAVHGELALVRPGRRALNPFDLLLAFGCGWRRDVDHERGGWWGRWEVAYAAMIFQVQASLVASNHLLVNRLPQFALDSDDLSELPGDFTVSLLGACNCGHHRRGCRASCGKECCYGPHDIGSWNPLTCHLRPFVDQAVRGTATKQILGGAFAESLIYRDLERQGRILRRRVEFIQCPACLEWFETSCQTPGCPGPEGVAVRRESRPNRLILPAQQGGNYVEVVRWECGACKSLYPIRFQLREPIIDDPCPVCRWTPPEGTAARRVTVWVRIPDQGAPGDPCDLMVEVTDDH